MQQSIPCYKTHIFMQGSTIFSYSNNSSLLMVKDYNWNKAEETIYLRRQTEHVYLPTCIFAHMMSYPFSKAWSFAPSEVLYFLKYGLWANWYQSLCKLVFVFHTKEYKLSSLLFVFCFVTIESFELQNVVPVVLKPAAGHSYKGMHCIRHTSDWQLQLL